MTIVMLIARCPGDAEGDLDHIVDRIMPVQDAGGAWAKAPDGS